jgi:iron complex outermembrane receptor protein
LNTNRISIRGIGSRAQYGTQKIKAYYEGIPLTTAEGSSTIEDIDMETIGSIEIIKGPNSTSFGSGLGGVINLFAREIPMDEFQTKSTTTYGSFGLLKQSFSGNYGEALKGSVNYNHLQSDGFRQIPLMIENHSRYKANKR